MSSGVDEPPGVQNFSSWPSRMPPDRSSSSRSVMPIGASYWPGPGHVAGQREQRHPLGAACAGPRRRCPSRGTTSAPLRRIDGTLAIDSTLLMTVGRRVEAGDRRERRAQPRLAAAALERVEQRRLLAADVGAGAGVHDDLEVEAGAEDVLAEVARLVRLGDRRLQPAQDVHHLAADVDEGVRRADGVRRDDHALHQLVRVGHHERDVLAGARLGLVGVDDQVVRLVAALRDEAPLHAGREAGAAAAAQLGVLDQLGDAASGSSRSAAAQRRRSRRVRS